jgi:hypothetical protein
VDGGKIWTKRGTPAPHEANANRMNVAAGLSSNGKLIVIASGWSLKPGDNPKDPLSLIAVLRPWVSHSADGGSSWTVEKSAFPQAEKGMTEYIPFGDILPGQDGALRVLAYAQSLDKAINKVSMFRSEDDGCTWKWMSFISEGKGNTKASGGHNETAFYYMGKGNWIAAARRWKAGMAIDLFSSGDDGKSWELLDQITDERQHPGHVMQLANGNLLLTYGNRKYGEFGVAVKMSKDKGKTWGDEFIVIDDLGSGDAGYPSSVQLPDGTMMTAYYSNGMEAHKRFLRFPCKHESDGKWAPVLLFTLDLRTIKIKEKVLSPIIR